MPQKAVFGLLNGFNLEKDGCIGEKGCLLAILAFLFGRNHSFIQRQPYSGDVQGEHAIEGLISGLPE
jgi:hypothetical protein